MNAYDVLNRFFSGSEYGSDNSAMLMSLLIPDDCPPGATITIDEEGEIGWLEAKTVQVYKGMRVYTGDYEHEYEPNVEPETVFTIKESA